MLVSSLQEELDEIQWGLTYPTGIAVPRFYEVLHEIRATTGVAKGWLVHGMPCYLITRYDDVRAAMLDLETFSARDMYEMALFPFTGPTLTGLEGHEHTELRRVVSARFTRSAIHRDVTPLLHERAERLVDACAERGAMELMGDFAKQFPLAVISELMGLPVQDWKRVADWARMIFFGDGSLDPARVEQVRSEASVALRAWLAPLIEERRRQPQDDVTSDLVTGQMLGRPLTDAEVVSFLLLLFPAGIDTTWLGLGSMMAGVLSTPGAWEALRADPSLRPRAVEESLRWETPTALNARISRRDAVVSGVEIPAGSWVMQAIAAANHDPDRFEDPDTWRLDRGSVEHISFAFGEHYCQGSHLARAEMLAALDVFLDRFPTLHLTEPVQFVGSGTRGPAAVRLAW